MNNCVKLWLLDLVSSYYLENFFLFKIFFFKHLNLLYEENCSVKKIALTRKLLYEECSMKKIALQRKFFVMNIISNGIVIINIILKKTLLYKEPCSEKNKICFEYRKVFLRICFFSPLSQYVYQLLLTFTCWP